MDEHLVVGVFGCLSIFVITGAMLWCVAKFV
jgi:hypothetical protein